MQDAVENGVFAPAAIWRQVCSTSGGMTNPHFVAGPRFFRDQHEFEHWHEIRLRGFTEWYVGRTAPRSFANGRHVANAKARLFPEFLPQVRTDDGKPVAYLNTVPGFWCGDRQALHDLNYYDDTLQFGGLKTLLLGSSFLVAQRAGMLRAFDAVTTPFRNRKLSGANCIVLIGMTVDPAYQSMKLPSLLFSTVKEAARRLRMKYVVGPFRPNAYGQYKAERHAAHSNVLFEKYCAGRNEDGLPRDPWMRTVFRQGAEFVRIEPRSFRVARSIARFEEFRARFKPESWYSPTPDVWECGETPTWYVDRCKGEVVSVEPNIWGVIQVADAIGEESEGASSSRLTQVGAGIST